MHGNCIICILHSAEITTVGEVKGATFVRLLELLVLLSEAEVWGCGGLLGSVENVQMWAARIKLGMGSLHLLVFLQFEIDLLPLKWEAIRRGIDFRVQVMRMDDNRWVRW